MNPVLILYPVAALALLTLGVLGLIPYQRFKASFAGQVGPDDFKYGESERVPPAVTLPNRNLMNLLELPVLFYVACILLFVTRTVDAAALSLAWTYVGLRLCHSIVHLSYNKVQHRLMFFALSNFVLVVLWLRIVYGLGTVT